VLAQQAFECCCVARDERVLSGLPEGRFVRGAGKPIDLFRERLPRVEAVLTRDLELRIRQFAFRLCVAGFPVSEKVFRLFSGTVRGLGVEADVGRAYESPFTSAWSPLRIRLKEAS